MSLDREIEAYRRYVREQGDKADKNLQDSIDELKNWKPKPIPTPKKKGTPKNPVVRIRPQNLSPTTPKTKTARPMPKGVGDDVIATPTSVGQYLDAAERAAGRSGRAAREAIKQNPVGALLPSLIKDWDKSQSRHRDDSLKYIQHLEKLKELSRTPTKNVPYDFSTLRDTLNRYTMAGSKGAAAYRPRLTDQQVDACLL